MSYYYCHYLLLLLLLLKTTSKQINKQKYVYIYYNYNNIIQMCYEIWNILAIFNIENAFFFFWN